MKTNDGRTGNFMLAADQNKSANFATQTHTRSILEQPKDDIEEGHSLINLAEQESSRGDLEQ